MTPAEALDLLDRVSSTFNGNRVDHVDIQNAVLVLRNFITTSTPMPEEANTSEAESVSSTSKEKE